MPLSTVWNSEDPSTCIPSISHFPKPYVRADPILSQNGYTLTKERVIHQFSQAWIHQCMISLQPHIPVPPNSKPPRTDSVALDYVVTSPKGHGMQGSVPSELKVSYGHNPVSACR